MRGLFFLAFYEVEEIVRYFYIRHFLSFLSFPLVDTANGLLEKSAVGNRHHAEM